MRKIPLLSIFVLLSLVFPLKASALHPVTRVVGGIIGVPISMFTGLVRGAASKGVSYTGGIYNASGGGAKGLLAAPIGLAAGIVAGGVTGTLKGAVDGVLNGIVDPLTPEALSITGKFLKYDPYDLLLPFMI